MPSPPDEVYNTFSNDLFEASECFHIQQRRCLDPFETDAYSIS